MRRKSGVIAFRGTQCKIKNMPVALNLRKELLREASEATAKSHDDRNSEAMKAYFNGRRAVYFEMLYSLGLIGDETISCAYLSEAQLAEVTNGVGP